MDKLPITIATAEVPRASSESETNTGMLIET